MAESVEDLNLVNFVNTTTIISSQYGLVLS